MTHLSPNKNNDIESPLTLKVFPTPADDVLNIELSQNQGQALHVQIYNSLGLVVKDISFSKGSYLEQLSVDALPAGIYFLRINVGELTQYDKFIKK